MKSIILVPAILMIVACGRAPDSSSKGSSSTSPADTIDVKPANYAVINSYNASLLAGQTSTFLNVFQGLGSGMLLEADQPIINISLPAIKGVSTYYIYECDDNYHCTKDGTFGPGDLFVFLHGHKKIYVAFDTSSDFGNFYSFLFKIVMEVDMPAASVSNLTVRQFH